MEMQYSKGKEGREGGGGGGGVCKCVHFKKRQMKQFYFVLLN